MSRSSLFTTRCDLRVQAYAAIQRCVGPKGPMAHVGCSDNGSGSTKRADIAGFPVGPLASYVPTKVVQGLPVLADAGPEVARRTPPVIAKDAPNIAVVVTIRVSR